MQAGAGAHLDPGNTTNNLEVADGLPADAPAVLPRAACSLRAVLALRVREALAGATDSACDTEASARQAAQLLVNYTLSHAELALPPAMAHVLHTQLFVASWSRSAPVLPAAPRVQPNGAAAAGAS